MIILDSLRAHLTALLDRAQADGLAVIPIDVVRELLDGEPRTSEQHEIVFPGPSATWIMRHPADCTALRCAHADAARWQFPPHDGCHSPGEFVAQLHDDGHLITESLTAKGI